MLIMHPPATAGGTDLFQVSLLSLMKWLRSVA
jgi:hypothetical protein